MSVHAANNVRYPFVSLQGYLAEELNDEQLEGKVSWLRKAFVAIEAVPDLKYSSLQFEASIRLQEFKESAHVFASAFVSSLCSDLLNL
jgi:hypothetical protein